MPGPNPSVVRRGPLGGNIWERRMCRGGFAEGKEGGYLLPLFYNEELSII